MKLKIKIKFRILIKTFSAKVSSQFPCIFEGLNFLLPHRLSFTSSFIISFYLILSSTIQFISVTQSCLTLCDPMNRSTPGLPVCHQLPKFTQTHVHWVGDAIQPSHTPSSPSPPAPNPPQHQDLLQWVNSLHEVATVLKFQLQYQSFQWTPRTDLL